MQQIKPITTVYKDCRFRSRLEARWAVFFDSIGVPWEYEKEGYVLEDGTMYLPDFWLPLFGSCGTELGYGFWIEIKPREPSLVEREKLKLLAHGTGHTTYCFWDFPAASDKAFVTVYKHNHPDHGNPEVPYINKGCPGALMEVTMYEDGETIETRFFIRDLQGDHCVHAPWNYPITTFKQVMDAVKEAKSARFEHGESGAQKHYS